MRPGTRCGPTLAKAISIRAASCAFRARRATRPRSPARRAGGGRLSVRDGRGGGCGRRRWPFLEPGTFRYAFVSPEGGALHCRKIASGLAKWLRANGANVYENSKVTAVDAEAGRVELAGGETMQADRVVVTAGAWVLKLFPELGGRIENLSHRARLCGAAGRPEGSLGGGAGHSRCRRQDRRLHDPAVGRRRHEIRLGPAQGADQRRRLEPRSRSKARARRSATCFRRRSPGSASTG